MIRGGEDEPKPGQDYLMNGPAIIHHDGMDLVHHNDYKRVKGRLDSAVGLKDEMKAARLELETTVSDLKEQLETATAMTSLSKCVKKGRNFLNQRRKDFTPEDHDNERKINEKVKEMFPDYHYPPEGWDRYSETPRTICGIIMRVVTVKNDKDRKKYWELLGGAMANRAWIDQRSWIDKGLRKEFTGE